MIVSRHFQWHIILSCFFFVVTVMCVPASAAEIEIFTSNMPPYSVDRSPDEPGFSTELINEVFKQAKIAFNPKFVPWARAQLITQDPKNTHYMMFTLSRTEDREPRYKWVFKICPIRTGFISLGGRPLNSIQEAKDSGGRIGVCDGTPWLKFLEKHQVDLIDHAPNERSNGLKLINGRIDLWYTAQDRGYYYLKKLGLKKQPVVGKPLQEYDLYLVANLNFPDDIINDLNLAYQKVIAQGKYDQLRDKYFSFDE